MLINICAPGAFTHFYWPHSVCLFHLHHIQESLGTILQNWTPLEAVNSWHVQKHVFPPSNHPIYATKSFIMAATTYFSF